MFVCLISQPSPWELVKEKKGSMMEAQMLRSPHSLSKGKDDLEGDSWMSHIEISLFSVTHTSPLPFFLG